MRLHEIVSARPLAENGPTKPIKPTKAAKPTKPVAPLTPAQGVKRAERVRKASAKVADVRAQNSKRIATAISKLTDL